MGLCLGAWHSSPEASRGSVPVFSQWPILVQVPNERHPPLCLLRPSERLDEMTGEAPGFARTPWNDRQKTWRLAACSVQLTTCTGIYVSFFGRRPFETPKDQMGDVFRHGTTL